eukprot:TRINITY_DN7615_c0_g1_i2.p1 TRINITY_DN7615_c0_g1~~TRINITY_DN7615_c0_g1_i2.p1  ORF type:complete len:280 (-),score=34.36 TRINITY_DN7615_c0_g1_i2:24-767(-)
MQFWAEDQSSSTFDSADTSDGDMSSRDSVKSLLGRGRSNLSDIWDPEANRFAGWWDDFDADVHMHLRGTDLGGHGDRKERYDLYRLYAAKQARETIARVLLDPFIARHAAKQELVGLYVLVRCWAKSRDHGHVNYLRTGDVAQRVLAFLGHQLKVRNTTCHRQHCIDFEPVCPLFQHRMRRCFGVYSNATDDDTESTDNYSEDAWSDASDISTGSLTAAREELSKYILQQCCCGSKGATDERTKKRL